MASLDIVNPNLPELPGELLEDSLENDDALNADDGNDGDAEKGRAGSSNVEEPSDEGAKEILSGNEGPDTETDNPREENDQNPETNHLTDDHDPKQDADPDKEDDAEIDPPTHRFDDDIENERNTPHSSPLPREASDDIALAQDDANQLNDTIVSLTSFLRAPSSAPALVTAATSELSTNGPGVLASILSLIVGVARPIIENEASALISPDTVIRNEPGKTVSELTPVLAATTRGRIPALAKDAHSKRVRRGYEDFWRRFAAEAGDAIIFDTDCFETVISWLEAMAGASSRGLRAAACLAAYRIVDGFIAFGVRLRKQLSGMQRQFATEKVKCGISSSSGKSTPRGKAKALSAKGKELERKVEDLAANDSELTELCDKVFRSIFILKFRDIAPEIRIISVNALASWIVAFPQHFLDDVHNKYIGWLLFDKDAGVRKASLEVLRDMIQKRDFFPSLELFLQRFCNRMVEMSRDKDDSVAVAAIQLLTCLVPYNMLEQESCEAICAMAIEEPHVELRRAAGQFFAQIIILQSSGTASTPSKQKRGRNVGRKGRRASVIIPKHSLEIPPLETSREHIKQLLFFVADRGEEETSFAVDAIWDYLPALRCWEAFDDLLIEKDERPSTQGRARRARSSRGKPSSSQTTQGDNDALKENDKAVLCEILVSSAQEVSGHGDAVRAKELSLIEYENGETPAMMFSCHMIGQLSKMLIQFQADARAMKALVKLPSHFTTHALEQEGRDEQIQMLLDRLIDALTRHTGRVGVTMACSDTFRVLLSEDSPLKGATMSSLQLAFKSASNELSVAVRSELADSEPETVSAALLRVRVLGELVEPSGLLHQPVVKLLKYHLCEGDSSSLGDDAVMDAVRIAYGLIVWGLLKIRSRMDSMQTSGLTIPTLLSMDDMKETQAKGAEIIDLLVRMCLSGNVSVSLKMICLQGTLTSLTLCRGIERMAVENIIMEDDEATQDARNIAEGKIDLLLVKASRDVVAESVSKCAITIVESELTLMRKRNTSRRQSQESVPNSSPEDLKDCFAALVQASVQSVIAMEICHLPILGLTLKGRRAKEADGLTEVSTLELCRQYYERQIMRNSGIAEEEIRILVDCEAMADDGGFKGLSRDVAESMVLLRRGVNERNTAATNIIAALVKWIVEDDEEVAETALSRVRMLCNVGTGLLGVLTEEGANAVKTKLKRIENLLEKDWIVEECGTEASSLEGFVKALEVVEDGRSRSGRQRNERTVETELERTPPNAVDVKQIEIENDPVTRTIRKSTRRKKQVNYATPESDSEVNEVTALQYSDDGNDIGKLDGNDDENIENINENNDEDNEKGLNNNEGDIEVNMNKLGSDKTNDENDNGDEDAGMISKIASAKKKKPISGNRVVTMKDGRINATLTKAKLDQETNKGNDDVGEGSTEEINRAPGIESNKQGPKTRASVLRGRTSVLGERSMPSQQGEEEVDAIPEKYGDNVRNANDNNDDNYGEARAKRIDETDLHASDEEENGTLEAGQDTTESCARVLPVKRQKTAESYARALPVTRGRKRKEINTPDTTPNGRRPTSQSKRRRSAGGRKQNENQAEGDTEVAIERTQEEDANLRPGSALRRSRRLRTLTPEKVTESTDTTDSTKRRQRPADSNNSDQIPGSTANSSAKAKPKNSTKPVIRRRRHHRW